MREDKLSDFTLVGGTALALQIRHRISVDIDLFTDHSFDPKEILYALRKTFESGTYYEQTKWYSAYC